jgi:hypothetical protein
MIYENEGKGDTSLLFIGTSTEPMFYFDAGIKSLLVTYSG